MKFVKQKFDCKRSTRIVYVDIKLIFYAWPNLWRRQLMCLKLGNGFKS